MPANHPIIHTSTYKVHTPVFDGPLDLLLQLIERAELDITRLAIAQVTDQYLAYIRALQETAADEVSAFLVIAARLIQIKSEMLLPRPVVREEGEEDPGEALARQLRIYKRFKEISAWMAARESEGLHTYLRLAPAPKFDIPLDLSGITLDDLLEAIYAILQGEDQRQELGSVVTAPRVTIREKIGMIAHYLRSSGQVSFRHILSRQATRLEIVVTFLAMLELIKRSAIVVNQDNLFSDILITPSPTWDDSEVFELEFGE